MWLSVCFLTPECFVLVSAHLSSSCSNIWNNNTLERIILFLDETGLKSKRPSILNFIVLFQPKSNQYCSKKQPELQTTGAEDNVSNRSDDRNAPKFFRFQPGSAESH